MSDFITVPREPTEAMVEAGQDLWLGEGNRSPDWARKLRGTWSAMLSAHRTDRGVAGFLEQIMAQSPNGETVAVKYHPNGDWSVDRLSASDPDSAGQGVGEVRAYLMTGTWELDPTGRSPGIYINDPDGGDPICLGTLSRIYHPELLRAALASPPALEQGEAVDRAAVLEEAAKVADGYLAAGCACESCDLIRNTASDIRALSGQGKGAGR